MRTRTKFIVGLVAAAVTYGSLWALAGPRPYGRAGYQGRGAFCAGNSFRQQAKINFFRPANASPHTVTVIL